MISVIICSVNPSDLEKISNSMKDTIGVQYEIVPIYNNENNFSLLEAYDKGALVSKYEFLVFVHEDVEFITNNWGEKLLNILNAKEIGVVSVAGSTYLPSVPSGWYLPDERYNKVFIHQGFKYCTKPVRLDDQGEDLTPVFLLDGVFLAMRKTVWQEFQYNKYLDGFHAYDVDISQRVSSEYQNVFTKQIEILHHSEGKVDKNYFDAILEYKKAFVNFKYPKRDFRLEFQLLQKLYTQLRCYYEKNECIEKLKPYIKIKNLGWKGYFSFFNMLRNEK